MRCGYCGSIDGFDIDEDGREFCYVCGHYTGYVEEYWEDD